MGLGRAECGVECGPGVGAVVTILLISVRGVSGFLKFPGLSPEGKCKKEKTLYCACTFFHNALHKYTK